MRRSLEEPSRHDRRATLGEQALGKRARIVDATNAGKDDRARVGQEHFDLGAAAQELVDEWKIDREERRASGLEPVQLREGERRQPLPNRR